MELKEGSPSAQLGSLSSSLSSSVITELQSNLSSSSSSREFRKERSSEKSAPPVSTSLTAEQIKVVADAATLAVSQANLGESEDLSVVKQSLHDYQSLPVGAIPVASR